MEEISEQVTFDGLVVATENVEPYVFAVPPDLNSELDGELEVLALVVMKREAGVLLSIPAGCLSQSVIDSGNSGDADCLFGPSTELEIPGVVLDGGSWVQTGTTVRTLVVDCLPTVADYMRQLQEEEPALTTFDPDDPLALPSLDPLVVEATKWITSHQDGRMSFYSAEEGRSTPRTRRPKSTAAKATPTGRKQERGGRITTAILAANLEAIMETIPNLAEQISVMTKRQMALEEHLSGSLRPATLLAQPLSSTAGLPSSAAPGMASVAKALEKKPKVRATAPAGLLASPLLTKPAEVQELEDEKIVTSEGNLAQAVLAQSQALTTLVSQIASSQQDPLLDLTSSSSSASTRGAIGRAKLQAELALQKGTFFQAVLRSMTQRMSPSTQLDLPPSTLLERGISGTRYLERFGGYGRMKEWGHLQWQVMTIFDLLMDENLPAARDATALLAVTLEQGVMDNGRLDIASLLCLQEEPPSSVFSMRNAGLSLRSKAFAPLADQRWVTVALSFMKEMEVIGSKRLEFTSAKTPVPPDVAAPVPKVKPKAKQKGRGKGRGGQSTEEEEA